MEDLIQKLTQSLHQHFQGSEVEIEPAGGDRISGFLIWRGFEGREHLERQREVWNILRSELTSDEQRRVAAILTLTPEEMSAARAG